MADDGIAAERARLEALAWGGTGSESEAAEARIALQRLAQARRGAGARTSAGTSRPGGTPTSVTPRAAATGSAPQRSRAPSASVAPTTGPEPGMARPAGTAWPGGTADAHAAVRNDGTADRHAALPDDGTADARAVVPGERPGRGADGARDDLHDETLSDGAEPRLQADAERWQTRVRRLLWTTRPRVWIALGAAAAVGVAFAAGTVVGTSRQDPAAAPSVTPTAGTITLEDLLDAPQTYADQLPGPVEAPVSLRTTRLIFTNRALDGSAFNTPWSVWAGVGTDRSTICLVATANRIQSTSACYPRTDALHGSVSLSAQSTSGTLTLTLRGGGVQGTVTNEN
ncbi:hypothetical protein SAMN02800687_3162 [Curtobacterium sp. UNCCL20]|uniref:hypothetical protein n=1 Tax=Curtobacterium sp. UNCCL20 TaxID=1502773 RepID=UPI00088537F8|nr:hypothetical protein [Curtobacterium sp. UNCCL20]SDQ93679.1 hypothetical protein SAMN02800687_3162 [Curtobacterium sp. UNCCL20]